MNIIQVKFTPWDKSYNFDAGDIAVKKGDWVLVRTEIGTELAQVVNINVSEKELKDMQVEQVHGSQPSNINLEIKTILRKADITDIKKMQKQEKDRKEAFSYCKKIIKKLNLPMKLFDVRLSYDAGRVTFAYIAPERIDFRELVKELTHKFKKSIRMHQVGVREEARISCNIGLCGREVCCHKFLKDLGNVTLDQAYLQQVAHRGSERISGICGRLLCCLKYEQPMYEEFSKILPPIGSEMKTEKGKGKVVAWHILKQTVDVKIDKDTRVEVEIKK